jgi:hypothetical protein
MAINLAEKKKKKIHMTRPVNGSPSSTCKIEDMVLEGALELMRP